MFCKICKLHGFMVYVLTLYVEFDFSRKIYKKKNKPNEILNYRQWIRFLCFIPFIEVCVCVCLCCTKCEHQKSYQQKKSRKRGYYILLFGYSFFFWCLAPVACHHERDLSISYGYTSMFKPHKQTTTTKCTKIMQFFNRYMHMKVKHTRFSYITKKNSVYKVWVF